MKLAVAWLALFIFASGASAEEPDPVAPSVAPSFARPGYYVGAGGAYASDIFESEVEEVVEDAFGLPVHVDVAESWGANGRFGYRFGGWFAAEIQYEWLDEFDIDVSALGLPIGQASLESQAVTVNGRLIAPLWRTQPYLMVGVGGALYDFEDDTLGDVLGGSGEKAGFSGRAGGGVDLHLSEHFVLNAEASVLLTTNDFQVPGAGNIDDLYYVAGTVGLRYQF
jgi:opacity protein-like surface antigen